MFTQLKNYCDELKKDFNNIPKERKTVLEKISHYITKTRLEKGSVHLVYICTHNSRRSHFGQIWATVASDYYKIPDIHTYSGGTEATAFNSNAINALMRAGFKIKPVPADQDRVYHVHYDDHERPIESFSKVYDDPKNPQSDFAAIMTCGEAEENCPFIPGVDLRIATTYDDPKVFDDTELQDAKYDERCRQIALETLYVFSQL